MKKLLYFCLLTCFSFACQTNTPDVENTPNESLATLSNPQWEIQLDSLDIRFQAISIVDANTVWASGTQGSYAKTTDGGMNWEVGQVAGADSLEFRDVEAIDALTAFLMSAGEGKNSRIYKTTDGGQNWIMTFQNEEREGFFDCMDFWDTKRGIAFSDSYNNHFYLITTEDAGDSWQRIPVEHIPPAYDGEGSFASSGTCLITQPNGHVWFGTGASGIETRVFHSPDYGKSWEASVTPLVSQGNASGTYSLAFKDAKTGWAFGGDYTKPDEYTDNIAMTTDGGKTWKLLNKPNITGSIYGGAYVPNTSTLVIVGPTGSDLSNDFGESWTQIDTLNYWSVGFYGKDAGWAVGPNGKIAKLKAD